MGVAHRNLRETHIIDWRCQERFLPLESSACELLRARQVSLAGMSRLRKRYEIARLDPPFHLALLTLRGTGWLETGEAGWVLEPGELLILPAHTAASYRLRGASWDILWFHLRERQQWRFLEGTEIDIRKVEGAAALEAAMEGVLAEHGRSGSASKRLLALYGEQIDILLRRLIPSPGAPPPREEEALRAVWQEVAANLAFPWDVRLLARRLHVSPGHFHRLVQMIHGESPMARVTRLRMERAEVLLRVTADPIASIAERVGYENPYAFSTAFRRHAGTSPRDWRNSGE